MIRYGVSVCLLAAMLVTGCGRKEQQPAEKPAATADDAATVSFVNRGWEVAESTGMSPGQLVVFLADGTLVFASPDAEPSLGTWGYVGESLTMTEEGIPYTVEILDLTPYELRILSHNPGAPVETRFIRGDGTRDPRGGQATAS